jgi:sugar phosphate isomerase/epimerase
MKLSFTTLGCPDWTIDQVLERAAAYGFQGVELRTHDDGNHLSPDTPLEQARALAERFTAAGVPVMSLMGYTRFAFRETAEVAKNQALMRKLIALAEAMGVPHIRTFAGAIPQGATQRELVPIVAQALKPLAAEAAARGVAIVLETHDDWCASGPLLELVAAIGSRRGFGLIWDVSNAIAAGYEPWRTTYRRLKPHIRYCHVKDRIKLGERWAYAPLGAGELPWRTVLTTLKKDRFRGYLSFEWEKKWIPELEPPERVFPQYVAKVRSILAAAPA